MKRLFTLLAVALWGIVTWSCSYDDKDLWKAVNDLDGRVELMEQAVKSANTNIEALQKLVKALQQNVTISSVEKLSNGYTIHFSDETTATITNGENGTNAPALSVVKDGDGLYYWALDGTIVEVDGRKLRAEGADGVTPRLRINPDTSEWEMSTDGGAVWTSMGVKAEGTDGDSMFSAVDTTSKPGFVLFTLTAGGQLEIPLQRTLSITLSPSTALFTYGQTQQFTLVLEGVEKITATKPDGWRVSIDGTTLTVTAPGKENSYAESEGLITLIGLGGNYSCMAELQVKVATRSHTITFEGDDWTKWVVANYAAGKFSTTQIGSPDDYRWTDPVTQLTTGRPTGFINGWGYPWFVCSYNSNSLDQSKYGGYLYDLFVYNPEGGEERTTGGGHNASDNFLTTFGYLDLDYPYGDGRPILEFADKQPRVIKSLYVTSTCYFYSVATSGNGLSPALSRDVTYYATGYDAEGHELKTVTMVFATPASITKQWTEWDLSALGPIVSLRLNQSGGADNGYGYSLPAYYALDDITVVW